MKELILRIVMAQAREVLDKTNELDEHPEVKEMILSALEEWLRGKLGI